MNRYILWELSARIPSYVMHAAAPENTARLPPSTRGDLRSPSDSQWFLRTCYELCEGRPGGGSVTELVCRQMTNSIQSPHPKQRGVKKIDSGLCTFQTYIRRKRLPFSSFYGPHEHPSLDILLPHLFRCPAARNHVHCPGNHPSLLDGINPHHRGGRI